MRTTKRFTTMPKGKPSNTKVIEASVELPKVTLYPEYPGSEFSSSPAFDINVAVPKVTLKSKHETDLRQETVLNATGIRDVARLGRAKKIFHSSKLN